MYLQYVQAIWYLLKKFDYLQIVSQHVLSIMTKYVMKEAVDLYSRS